MMARVAALGMIGFKLFKVAKALKIALMGGSLAAYSYLFTFEFACALLVMIFIHECGHVAAMKAHGMRVKGVYFIPFLGGAAVTDDQFPTYEIEASVALAGPLAGLALSVGLLPLAWLADSAFMMALAGINAQINLLQFLPIMPMDGGRVFRAAMMTFNHWAALVPVVALSLGLGLMITIAWPLFGVVLVIGAIDIAIDWHKRIRPPTDGTMALTHLGSAVLLFFALVGAVLLATADPAVEIIWKQLLDA